jgi:hypothetical protein
MDLLGHPRVSKRLVGSACGLYPRHQRGVPHLPDFPWGFAGSLNPCHPDRSGAGFPISQCQQRPPMRLSFKESRTESINATVVDRKSGGAQWRDLQFSGPFSEMFFD